MYVISFIDIKRPSRLTLRRHRLRCRLIARSPARRCFLLLLELFSKILPIVHHNLLDREQCLIADIRVLEQLQGKQLVMRLLSHKDPNVRYQALLAVQKIMVHNWEYLGKQLEKEKEAPAGGAAGDKAAPKAVTTKS